MRALLLCIGCWMGSVVRESPGGATITVGAAGADHTTIQAALAAAAPGDTVLVRAGVYGENVSFPRSGTAAGPITLKGEAGAILDGSGKGPAGITIAGMDHVRVIGLTVRHFKNGGTPTGIKVTGSSSHLQIRDNVVHHIESPHGNAHGISFHGSSDTPMSHLLVDGNEIRDCRLGQSEAMVLNGNVTDFIVSRNRIHDNDNIGIDFIGFEGTGPDGQDQARRGVCTDNVIYNISSAANPTYGGGRSAGGIYVDGGRDIVIERNRVDRCDIGIEVACEHRGKAASGITVRNNFVSRSHQSSIMIGGSGEENGGATGVAVVHNTLVLGGGGEVELQHHARGVAIRNNVCYAKAGKKYLKSSGGDNTDVAAENNLYWGSSTSSPGAFPDARARFADPLLVSFPDDLHLQAGSPAIGAGIDLGGLAGASDVDGAARVQGGKAEIGADEVR